MMPRSNAPSPAPLCGSLDATALAITGGAVVGVAFVAADALARDDFRDLPASRYVLGAALLYAFAGTLAGLVALALLALGRVAARLGRRTRLGADGSAAALFGVLAGAAVADTAFWAFRGNGVARSAAARVAPWVVIAVVGSGAALVTWIARRADAARRGGRPRSALVVACLTAALACALAFADLELYVALYARLHTALEATAALLAGLSVALVAPLLAARSRRARLAVRAAAAACLAWTIAAIASPSARALPARELASARREPDYVGRMLLRVQLAERFLASPRTFFGEPEDQMARLLHDYDVQTTARARAWDDRPAESPHVRTATEAIRANCRRCNVLVFYVDTLRWDAAKDPDIMPAARDFADRAVAFDQAFTVGSDTTHALAGVLRGGYDLDRDQPDDLLEMARRGTDARALVIPKSAAEFLEKQRPEFRFDDTLRIPDYDDGRSVWGYGADRPSADPLVDAALTWLRARRDERFFLWLFNFDVHNWREIDGDHLERLARETGLPDDAKLNWRYRAAARNVDRAFARLLDGLDRMGLADDTIVVLLSDHGEGLGQYGFWVHSTFVWTSLVHVPLAIRIPGVAPRVVRDRVSLVDLAPTLARIFVPDADLSPYQGEDLLSRLVPHPPKRRLPILLVGSDSDGLAHLGLIEPEGRHKLVVPLRLPIPELYDLEGDDFDATDLASRERGEVLRLLDRLVRSPVFPRTEPPPPVPSERSAAVAP